MHHHLFPSEDTYITNLSGYEEKNFGLNEILRIGTDNNEVRTLQSTKNYGYTTTVWDNYCVTNFTGILSGSFTGSAITANGVIVSSASFNSSYFSGSIDGASIVELSGSVSGSISGSITGSLAANYFPNFSGQLTGSVGKITGTVTGTDTRNENWWETTTTKFIDRALIKFNLDSISSSISLGEITSPRFKLNLKVCNEYNLPISYKIYAFPISQSWTMGNGYYSDGGSDVGVNWYYTDKASGSLWYSPITTSLRPTADFLNSENNRTASFAYGGGTWYYSSSTISLLTTQSFEFESSDISMDVTPIVMSWISGSIPNNGFILMSSDEIVESGSGFTLTFYGKDTNSISSPYLDVMWDNWSWTTGSISTGSVNITSSYVGFDVTVWSGSSLTIASGISGSFSSSVFFTKTVLNDSYTNSFEAISLGQGLTGNITGLPIVGPVSGSINISSSTVTGACGNSFDANIVTASFTGGNFSGSTFTAFYVDNKFENALLTGSWTDAILVGTHVYIPLPSQIEPYAYAYLNGAYINGTAFGQYQTSGSTSASFSGMFINGIYTGGGINLQLSGSVYTSSHVYTSSVEMTSSVFSNLDTDRPFTVIVKNLKPQYKGGDVVRVNVFGRKEFPAKTFGKTSQQISYIVPETLPTSSYYAIKDNMSEEIIIDFDNYTRISCDYPTGNYFMLDTTGLAQERQYRILIRIETDENTYTFDNNDVFKIVR